MRKLPRNKQAFSLIGFVAVLVAATLAISIATSMWLGLLTFTFTPTERIVFTRFAWGANNSNCQITVKNTGAEDLTIVAVRINGTTPASVNPSLTLRPYSLAKDTSAEFTLTLADNFTSGISYQFTVVTSRGNSFGPYVKTAP